MFKRIVIQERQIGLLSARSGFKKILERGSHDELIEQKGRYYRLYTGQFELS